MDTLATCYIEAQNYPHNLQGTDTSYRKLDTYTTLLQEHEPRLFSQKASLVFWDYCRNDEGFKLYTTKSVEDVRRCCLLEPAKEHDHDFRILNCRFIFLHSTNSRSALLSSREMLMRALSYHTVNPWFLDHLFPFGEQDEPQDFRFSSFRHHIYDGVNLNLEVPHLDRTGHEVHLCYNLRAAEMTGHKQMPWSVRQATMYHSFDFGSGQAFFIILKGNDSFCKDFRRESEKLCWTGSENDSKVLNSFSSSLKMHLSMCWWACDSWRLYINYIEGLMNSLTSQAVYEKVRNKAAPTRDFIAIKPQRKPTLSWLRRASRTLDEKADWQSSVSEVGGSRTTTWKTDSDMQSSVECRTHEPSTFMEPPYLEIEFPDLQRTQNVEEKANEALYALKSNIKIVEALQDLYQQISQKDNVNPKLRRESLWFVASLKPVLRDLEMYQASLETLMKVMTERKSLLLGILEFQSMQASKYFAQKAQISADSMERMTEEMQELTRKTKNETISMTAIAAVTMFFLPGTFVSTLMSTDIVQWVPQDDGSFQLQAAPGARNMFVALTLPLMFATFCIWWIVKWRCQHVDSHESIKNSSRKPLPARLVF